MLAMSPPPPPPVTITVTDQQEETAAGGETSYRIEVTNDSDVAYPQAVISQLLPASLSHHRSSPEANGVAANEVTWQVALPAHGSVTVTMVGTVTDAAGEVGRVSTTACVRAEPGQELAACATDADAVAESGLPGWVIWATAAVAAVGAGLAAWFVVRRRRS